MPDGGRGSGGVVEVFGAVLTLLSVASILFTFPLSAWMCAKSLTLLKVNGLCQVIKEYERAVIFRLGRVVKGRAKGPGLFWFIPWLDAIEKVDLWAVAFNMGPQEVLNVDRVPLKVDAVVFYRVVDPSLWVTRVRNGYQATHSGPGDLEGHAGHTHSDRHTVTEVKHHKENGRGAVLCTSRLWGVQVQRVELKDLRLPITLQRCMASEAEAIRKARAMMILAEGEAKASRALKEAASGLPPVASDFRYLQSLPSVQSSTNIVVCALPTELLHMFLSHQPQCCRFSEGK
ncbi:stomatin [Eleginops maclovinus]|uniref:stomatin n=1 Tax=Eleginops maclovinus TaxID=56733 RepID=UPI00307FE76B